MNHNEYLKISSLIEEHHVIFETFWKLGSPVFTDSEIDTACVKYQYDDYIQFIINEKFWSGLSDTMKAFVVSHECLHVILYHGLRIYNLEDKEAANKAADVVVNHMLVDSFGFEREEVDPQNRFCWVDTVCNEVLPKGKTMEYYYDILKQEGSNNGELVDDHSGFESFFNSSFEDTLSENIDTSDLESIKEIIEEHIDNDDLKKELKERGLSPGKLWHVVPKEPVKKKKKWESVIKKWAAFHMKQGENEIEQWAKLNRRLHFLNSDLMLPSNEIVEELNKEKHKIQVWFFQDASGSCIDLKDRFFRAAESLPEDRFYVKMHCFDMCVYETDLESRRVFGFGGTSFYCIEEYIVRNIKQNNLKYPDAVFVVTDGMGDYVQPLKPKNWYWFLSGNYTSCIPKECNKYFLKDFE